MSTAEERAPITADAGYEYYAPVETHMLRSKHVAQTFRVDVMLPARRHGEKVRFPVVYAAEGNRAFDMFKGLSHIIQSLPDARRFILVGIGYPGDSPRAGALQRARDYSFPGYPKFKLAPPAIDGMLRIEGGTKDYYGAEDFQDFIERELVPFIDERYETVQGERTYIGHSACGGFGLFTLFNRSNLFENYVISSPGLVYHGTTSAGIQYENYDFLLEEARRFIATGKSLAGVRLYMSVGSQEEFEPGLQEWQLTSSFYRMVKLLKTANIPGLTLTTEVFAGETHLTAWPISFIHGVQAVLDKARAQKK